jgi:hypothetical protein
LSAELIGHENEAERHPNDTHDIDGDDERGTGTDRNPGRHPCTCNDVRGSTVTCETSFVVASLSAECSDLLIPVGKKFVIQQILFSAWLPTGQSLLPGINYGVNSVSSGQTFFQIPTQKQIWNTADLHSASLPVTIYTDLNPGLTLFLTRNNSTGTGWARVILIGQLVAP